MIRKKLFSYQTMAFLGLMISATFSQAEVRPEVIERIKPVGVVVIEGQTTPVTAPKVVEKTAPVSPQAAEAPPMTAPVSAPPMVMPSAPVVAKSGINGEAIYNRSCAACHNTGAANAPVVGNKAVWNPRIAKGMDALYTSAISGVPGSAMPPRGTCATCSDGELKAAVNFMVSRSR